MVLGQVTVVGDPLQLAAQLGARFSLSVASFSSANRPASMRLASSISCSAFRSATLPICLR
nr:hypothetical protein DA06_25335 [Georgenia sp. SUBG003]